MIFCEYSVRVKWEFVVIIKVDSMRMVLIVSGILHTVFNSFAH